MSDETKAAAANAQDAANLQAADQKGMENVALAEGDTPSQNIAVADERGFLDAFNEAIPADDREEVMVAPSKELEEAAGKAPKVKEGDTKEKTSKDSDAGSEAQEEASEEEDGFFNDDEAEEPKEKDGFDEEAFDKETEELSKEMTKKQGARFKELRSTLKDTQKEMVTLKAKENISEVTQKRLEEAETKAKRADDLEAEMESLRNMSAKVRMESSDEYKHDVLAPVNGILAKAVQLAQAADADEGIIQQIIQEQSLKKKGELIEEHLSDLSQFHMNTLSTLSDRFSEMVEKRHEMLEDAQGKVEKFEAERVRKEQVAREERRNTMKTLQGDLWDKYMEKVPGLLDDDGVPTELFEKLKSRGLNIDFDKAKEFDLAYATFAGVMLPHLMGKLKKTMEELSKVDKQDRKERRSNPSMSDGKGVEVEAPGDGDEEKGFLERMKETSFA